MSLDPHELDELARARRLLQSAGPAITIARWLGKPLERSLALLPERATRIIERATRESLTKALRAALSTLDKCAMRRRASEGRHRVLSAAAGAVGGWFGLAGLALELPLTTTLMLRSIADIARSEGHDVGALEVQLACLEVFALGGSATGDDAAETGYYAIRAALSHIVSEAARQLAVRGLSRESSPVVVKLIERLAVRFGLTVQEKVLLEAVPVVGALGGAIVNTAFLRHFQEVARGHFIVRRLEERHGADVVRAAYETLEVEDEFGDRRRRRA